MSNHELPDTEIPLPVDPIPSISEVPRAVVRNDRAKIFEAMANMNDRPRVLDADEPRLVDGPLFGE